MYNKGADQTSHPLVCFFVISKQQSSLDFSCGGVYDVEADASWPPRATPLGIGGHLRYMGYFASLLHPQEERLGYCFQSRTCFGA